MTHQLRRRLLGGALAALLCASMAGLASAESAPAAAAAPAAVTGAREYAIDAVHSSVGFSVRHLVARVPGNFRDFSGTLTLDPMNVAGATGEFVAKSASIDTGNEKRDGHLASPDFFDVEKFPEIKFVIGSVTAAGDGAATVKGDFTMLGVTKPVEFAVADLAFADMGATGVLGFSATTKVNRKDFGMSWNKVLDAGGLALGDEVTITLFIEAKTKPPAPPAPAAAAPAGGK